MARTARTIYDSSLLEAALEGLEAQKLRIEQQIQEVRGLLGRRPGRPRKNPVEEPVADARPAGGTKTGRHLSEAARKRIAAAQKRRWAEYRKTERQNGKTE